MTASSSSARIVGAAESPYARRPGEGVTTTSLLADAFVRALDAAGLSRDDVDGLGVASFTLGPDHAVDLAWRLGLSTRWLMEDPHGGVSGLNLLSHGVRALEAGDAETIVLIAGDCFRGDDFPHLVARYNRATADHLAPIPTGGPNAQFALLTQEHSRRHGLTRADYGAVAIHQRRWASRNPLAVYREPLTLEEYLAAPIVADPLGRYDCVPVVSGADALVLTRRQTARPGVQVRAIAASFNHDNQRGDGLTTGLASIVEKLWNTAGLGPEAIDLIAVYDDYPVMVLTQLAELGFAPSGDVQRLVRERISAGGWPLNTSGGQLSCGQAGTAGGMHGLVEAATQLLGRAGDRQVAARRALVSGYGMVLYRYGACAAAAVLEAA
ncbi:MAG: thiolase family protein [Gaiellales bacterium]